MKFTGGDAVQLKDTCKRFPIWIDAHRIVAAAPRFRSETWGGRTYHIPDGTFLQLEDGEHAHVADELEDVVERLRAGEVLAEVIS